MNDVLGATETPQPKSTRYYSPAASVVLTVIVFFGSQVVGTALFVAAMLATPAFHGLSGDQIQEKLTTNRWLYLTLIVLMESLIVGSVLWLMRRRSISAKKLGFNRLQAKYIGYAAMGYAVVFGLNIVILGLIKAIAPGLDLDQKQDLGIEASPSSQALVPIFLALVIIPPFVEEFIMRGFLFTNLRAKLPFWGSATVVSLLFGLAHITQAQDGLFWSGAISFFTLSMVLCYLREKNNSLWPGIGVHMLQNGLAFMALYVWKVA